jgi:LPS-assembly protein
MKYNQIFSAPKIMIIVIFIWGWGLTASVNAQFFEISSPKMRLWADHIVLDRNTIEARGDVYIRQNPYSIYAGYIHIDLNTKKIIAERSVLAQFENTFISGNRLVLNINTQIGTIEQGTLFYEPGPLYIKGNLIEKTGEDTYYVDNVLVTGCDICDPDWSISGNDVHLTIDGYAWLWHGKMSVKNVPVFYTPFFIFPVKQDRQTGLLFPFVEHSTRKGFLYQQPFYWVIGKSYDATFYSTFMEKRGVMNGLEFRYNKSRQCKGTVMIDDLADRQQDTIETQSKWGYTNDDYLRMNTNRYWFRMKMDHPLPFQTMLHMDFDRVSDPDYLKTFDTGYTGLDKSRKNLFNRHHRDIDDADETFRFNRMMMIRTFQESRIYGEFQWFDDLYHHKQDQNDSPIQQLPIVRFSKIQSPLWHLPIFFDLDSLYAYEYQKELEKRHQLYMSSGLTLPLDIFPYFFLEQSFQWKGGYAHRSPHTTTASLSHASTAQQNTFKTCITSEIYKIYSFGSNHAKTESNKEYKHSIRLVTTYTHISDPKDSLNQFRLLNEETSKINWLLSNTWTQKIEKKQTRSASSIAAYQQRVKLALSGDYDILEDKNKNVSDQNDSRALSPIEVDFFWHADVFSFNADALWSIYDEEFIQYHMSLSVDDRDEKQLKIHYQYCEDKNESMDAEISAQLVSKLKLLAAYKHDILNDQRVQHGLGFEYKGPCWRLNGMFNDNADTDDRSVSVMIHLDGISN